MPATDFTRCIVLTPTRPASEAVRAALAERTWVVDAFDDPALAMAELAVCERAQAARSAWGLQRAGKVVLALDEPDSCAQVQPLLAAVKRYMPDVAIWDCSRGRLTPVHEPSETVAAAGVEPQESSVCDEAGINYQEAEAVREEADAMHDDEVEQAATISRAELDMLLDMGEDEQ